MAPERYRERSSIHYVRAIRVRAIRVREDFWRLIEFSGSAFAEVTVLATAISG